MDEQRGPHTPGLLGYLLAVLVSVVVVVVVLGLVEGGETTVTATVEAGLDLAALLVVLALPFAVPGVALVHLCCRRVPHQAVHVLAAGLAGVVSGLVVLVLGLWSAAPVVVGGATALGRLSVVPLVERRRRRALLQAGAVPVDDDFPATPPAR